MFEINDGICKIQDKFVFDSTEMKISRYLVTLLFDNDDDVATYNSTPLDIILTNIYEKEESDPYFRFYSNNDTNAVNDVLRRFTHQVLPFLLVGTSIGWTDCS